MSDSDNFVSGITYGPHIKTKPWVYNIHIADLEFSASIFKCLTAAKIYTLGEICLYTQKELARFNISQKLSNEIRASINTFGGRWSDQFEEKDAVINSLTQGFAYCNERPEIVAKYNPNGQTLEDILGRPNETKLLIEEYVETKIQAVRDTQGGTHVENLDWNDPLLSRKIEALQQSGIALTGKLFMSLPSTGSKEEPGF